MRWYINDVSLQGQFGDVSGFESVLIGLLQSRARFNVLRTSLHVTRELSDRNVTPELSLRELLRQARFRDMRGAVLMWLDRAGPFLEDDQQAEPDNYFEYAHHDVTYSGLGEATRRVKAGVVAATFSFVGGETNFSRSPLRVDHGLAEDRLGSYEVENFWTLDDFLKSADSQRAVAVNWRQLIEAARERFAHLVLPDAIFSNPALSREPFDASIRDRALVLLGHLEEYMIGRNPDGSEGQRSRAVIDQFFVGERALFSGESPTNQRDFADAMTFPDPQDSNQKIFGHWHGKINQRFFRMHFEWPVPANASKLIVLYLGPKITKG
jgi:hypothetical protein